MTSLLNVTFPHLSLAADPHDRVGEHRNDDDWLERAWADPTSRVLVVAGSRVRPVDGAVPWVPSAEAPEAGTRVLLGERDDRVWFALVIDAGHLEDGSAEGEGWVGIRDLLPHLAGAGVEQAPLVFHAIGLAEWLFATRHCPRCGGRLEPRLAGHELECVDCHRQTVPAHRPRGDHGDHRRRARRGRRGPAAGPPGRVAVGSLLDPGRVPGAGGDPGGRRTP